MIKIFIAIVLLSIPLSLIYLNLTHLQVRGKLLFTIFIIIAMIERIWETFCTPKDRDVLKFRGDWTLLATITTYFIVSLLMIFEFYATSTKNFIFVLTGLAIFISALILRFLAIKCLKEQWSIHLTDDPEDKKPILVKKGPYKYIRHPIYLGAILDLIGIAFITNAFFYLIIIFFVNTPLYIWRSLYEEKRNIKKFGKEYLIYKKEIPFMLPWKLFY